jgi:hypothetical protein
MKNFNFKMNDVKNVCQVLIQHPTKTKVIDTLILTNLVSIEHNGTNEMVWTSIDYNLCENFGFKLNNIEELQDKYNEEFDFLINHFNVKSEDFYIEWQDKARISGYITDGRGDTQRCDDYPLFQDNAGIFAKEVQAKGRYALARLSQQMQMLNGDWEPDWFNDCEKFIIYSYLGEFLVGEVGKAKSFLAFKTSSDAKLFLKKEIDAIIIANKANFI